MKTARLWLLVLLALLLPLRGALAAAMLCPVAAVDLQPVGLQGPEHRHTDHHPAQHAKDAASVSVQAGHSHDHPHDQHHDQHHDHGSGGAGKCNTCSAFCSVTPLPTPDAVWPVPAAASPIRFPDLAAPLAGFVPAGLERPPRAA
ncbi:hypothetical protein [Aquabacterium sp.]|uniref:hypothetical protein n=1 Tax=Aquabacterium sp. TaxID=1872578 RepID=UPI003783E030